LFPGSLASQIKIWLAIGLIGIPIGTIIFGLILKPITNLITKINIRYSRALLIQLCAGTAGWFCIVISVFIGLTGVSHNILEAINLILSTIVGALIYSKMIKSPEQVSIGLRKGLLVSITLNTFALLLNVPLKLLRVNI
jgi:hypothetical protein